MTHEPWPSDPAYARALLATVVGDIDRRDEEDQEALLAGFLCAARPSSWAQVQ
ncbi:MAG TPA: hypothetical protein VFQ12_09415 [Thermoleophilaceae bacterium]|nr:hypothetical protein [Thermoleophilaceae bacterium]